MPQQGLPPIYCWFKILSLLNFTSDLLFVKKIRLDWEFKSQFKLRYIATSQKFYKYHISVSSKWPLLLHLVKSLPLKNAWSQQRRMESWETQVENGSLITQEGRKGQTYILANFQRAMWKESWYAFEHIQIITQISRFLSTGKFFFISPPGYMVYIVCIIRTAMPQYFQTAPTLGISTWILQSYPSTSKIKVRTFLWKPPILSPIKLINQKSEHFSLRLLSPSSPLFNPWPSPTKICASFPA